MISRISPSNFTRFWCFIETGKSFRKRWCRKSKLFQDLSILTVTSDFGQFCPRGCFSHFPTPRWPWILNLTPKGPLKFQGASFKPIKNFWKKIFSSWFSGSGRKFWKIFWSVSISQVQWSFLSFLIFRFPMFNTRYRDLGQNYPKADATIIQIKANATVKGSKLIKEYKNILNLRRFVWKLA